MIETKRELEDWLNYEKMKYSIKWGGVKKLLGSEKATIWSYQKRLRLTEYYFNTNKKMRYILSKVILNYKSNKYGIHIGLNVFERGLQIMHLGPILTNGRARVGRNCSVHVNTALVAQGVSDDVPKLGDNIVIGVGATIVGNVWIANGIAVGANSLVNKSFYEENIAIAGVPAKKISNNGTQCWGKAKGEKC